MLCCRLTEPSLIIKPCNGHCIELISTNPLGPFDMVTSVVGNYACLLQVVNESYVPEEHKIQFATSSFIKRPVICNTLRSNAPTFESLFIALEQELRHWVSVPCITKA